MMKTISVIILMLIPLFGISQKSGLATYKISYLESNLGDEDAYLYFNQNKSFFETTAGPNNTFYLVIEDTLKSTKHKMKSTFNSNVQVFIDFDKTQIISYNEYPLIPSYYVKEKSNDIKWDIEKEERKIGIYTCTKAVCKFHGREYIAWFTREIPMSYGPWKFNGLPGLILEVCEINNFIEFQFVSFTSPYDTEINTLESDEYVTYEQYLNFVKNDLLKRSGDIKTYGNPNAIMYIDLSSFTELGSEN